MPTLATKRASRRWGTRFSLSDHLKKNPMGLDIIELILRTEEVFGITIPDEDAGQASTVGLL